MPSRKCARPGCRAWAMRDMDYCYSHRDRTQPGMDNVDEGTEQPTRASRSAAFARAARSGEIEQLVDQAVLQVIARIGADRSLENEIGALRIILRRIVEMDALDGDPKETAATVTRLVDSIVRAVKTQRQLSGGLADDISEALTTMLIDMGIGEA